MVRWIEKGARGGETFESVILLPDDPHMIDMDFGLGYLRRIYHVPNQLFLIFYLLRIDSKPITTHESRLLIVPDLPSQSYTPLTHLVQI